MLVLTLVRETESQFFQQWKAVLSRTTECLGHCAAESDAGILTPNKQTLILFRALLPRGAEILTDSLISRLQTYRLTGVSSRVISTRIRKYENHYKLMSGSPIKTHS